LKNRATILSFMAAALAAGGCNDDEGANAQLIGAECATAEDGDDHDDDTPAVDCVLDFKGGVCGREGCMRDIDGPKGSICVDIDGRNCCLLVCIDKVECNRHRSPENEANCSSNIDPVDGGTDKVCVPPSSNG
jgi:hypothetical protein